MPANDERRTSGREFRRNLFNNGARRRKIHSLNSARTRRSSGQLRTRRVVSSKEFSSSAKLPVPRAGELISFIRRVDGKTEGP